MKYLFFVCAMCITTLAICQPAGKYAAFRAQKKSIKLRTGITMKYIDTGNAKGTPVILLHGGSDTGRSFQFTIDELNRLNPSLRIIVPDLRGHGETSLPDANRCARAPEQCFTMAAFASDIIALMDQLHLGRVHMVGHSMGSIITQEIAIHHADRLLSQVLIGTFVEGKECRGIHDFMWKVIVEEQFKNTLEKRSNFKWPQDAYALTAKDLGPEVTSFLKQNWVTELGTEEAYLEDIYQETIQVPIGTWIGMVKECEKVDNREKVENIKTPTLILQASQDMIIVEPVVAQVKSSFDKAAQKHSTKVIHKTYGKTPLPASGMQENDFGHNLQWAAHKQVAADISAFINNGYPVDDISYIDPQNMMQIRTESSQGNITDTYKK